MKDHIAGLNEEHINFASLLDLLEAQLDRIHRADEPNYQLMLDIMYYMTHYPDQIHHPKEDLAFAKVQEREPGARLLVDEIMKQHVVVEQSGKNLVQELEGILNGSIFSRESIEAPGRTYIGYFRRHMQKEESEMFPVVARLLRDVDWGAIEVALQRGDDPLFRIAAEKRYDAIHEQIALEAN